MGVSFSRKAEKQLDRGEFESRISHLSANRPLAGGQMGIPRESCTVMRNGDSPNKSRALMVAGLCAIIGALNACSSMGNYAKASADFQALGKISVFLTMNCASPAQQQEVADLFAMQIQQKGYEVIDRAQIADLARESLFQNAWSINGPEGRAKLASRAVSVVIVVNANVSVCKLPPRYDEGQVSRKYQSGDNYIEAIVAFAPLIVTVIVEGSSKGWRVGELETDSWERRERLELLPYLGGNITIKTEMTDVRTGALLWSGATSESLKGSLFTPDKALPSPVAVAGAPVEKPHGTVIGSMPAALLSGTSGPALEQDLVHLLKTEIAATFEQLPGRQKARCE